MGFLGRRTPSPVFRFIKFDAGLQGWIGSLTGCGGPVEDVDDVGSFGNFALERGEGWFHFNPNTHYGTPCNYPKPAVAISALAAP